MKRYRLWGDDFRGFELHVDENGEWVKYEDVKKTEAELARLKELNREMYKALDKALHLLKTGKEDINDDTGDSGLTLQSGDFWVSTMNDIEPEIAALVHLIRLYSFCVGMDQLNHAEKVLRVIVGLSEPKYIIGEGYKSCIS